jgi:hypothetical protein
MIKPDDPELYKVAKKMAQSNQGDTAKIYQKLGGSFSSDKRLKSTKYEHPEESLFSINEQTFNPSWDQARRELPKEDDGKSDTKEDLKKGKMLLKKVYGGGSAPVKKVVKNYQEVIGHLQEHIKEGKYDKMDVTQSAKLRKEIPKLEKTKPAIGDPILEEYSNPRIVQQQAFKLFGKGAKIYRSSKKDKKYMMLSPDGKWVHFGQFPYEDFTRHGDLVRRNNYLSRATKIKGDWKSDPYSPNNLAIKLLWLG